MSLPVPTVVATGLVSAVGSAYWQKTDQLLISSGVGTITAVTAHTNTQVKPVPLGKGYSALGGIELSADGVHAYLAEEPGTLLRVPLNLGNMDRSVATVVASGLNGIDQIALDEAHGVAYVAESTGCHIQQINLTTGAKTVVANTDGLPRGVLMTNDGRFLYVSTDQGTITCFDLATNTSTVIASGLNGPRFLTWADDSESIILFPQPNPTGTVLMLDLTASPPTVRSVAGPTKDNPYSIAVVSPNQLLITTEKEISSVDLTSSKYSATGPILLGIGFVPADAAHLPNGYADTSKDPSYFFQVKDCPFGGTLPLMINWPEARKMKANYYQVFITPFGGTKVQVTQPFSDYLWNVNHFDLVPTVPDAGGFYKLRAAGETWLNNWLGLLLDTTGQPNGLNTISIKLFSAAKSGSEVGSKKEGRSATLMIDNTMPVAILEQILHQPGNQVVDACAIVNTGLPTFTFKVTASAPQSHLRGWDLTAYWGDNKSKPVAADNYNNHISSSRLWPGVTSVAVPPPPPPSPWDATVPGDQTSKHCAHSFFLTAWDRVINGWGYIHDVVSYHKSVTLML